MKILILSCKTGGGHDAAGHAIAEQLTQLGEEAYLFDHLLLAGGKVSDTVGKSYVRLVQKAPLLFGAIYKLGSVVSRIVRKSPVYYTNGLIAPYLNQYLQDNQFDAIIMPHLFPAETITYMKRKGMKLPLTIAVATDYTAIPFWSETECDYYVIPSDDLAKEFCTGKIRRRQLLAYGIPVSPAFSAQITKEDARRKLSICHKERIYLVVGGSMGAGQLLTLVDMLSASKKKKEHILVICGSNQKIKKKLQKRFEGEDTITILGHTDQMPFYLKSCDILYTKPGGLTSTEAAVAEIPLVHTAPIPGCESINRQYFRKRGISVSAPSAPGQIAAGLRLLEHPEQVEKMKENQRRYIPKDAAYQICKFVREHADSQCNV